jgi:hypothetical protein
MIDLKLDDCEAKHLERALARHLEELMEELAHTESHPLQHALRADYDRIEALYNRLISLKNAHAESSPGDGLV